MNSDKKEEKKEEEEDIYIIYEENLNDEEDSVVCFTLDIEKYKPLIDISVRLSYKKGLMI